MRQPMTIQLPNYIMAIVRTNRAKLKYALKIVANQIWQVAENCNFPRSLLFKNLSVSFISFKVAIEYRQWYRTSLKT